MHWPAQPQESENRPAHARLDAVIAVGIACASLTALVGTSSSFAMVWDEGHTVRREQTLATWFAWVARPPASRSRWEAFSQQAFAKYWPFSREEPDGHPPFYAILGLAGWWLTRNLFDPLTSYRFGPMLLCSATAAMLYFHLARRAGRLAGFTAAGSLLLMPRLFAHAHYAHYDMPMSCLWLIAQIAFIESLQSRRWVIPFGLALGLSASTKFTGWFAGAAPLAWVIFMEMGPHLRSRLAVRLGPDPAPGRFAGARSLAIGCVLAALVLYLLQPPWWTDPWDGLMRFLSSNLTRAESKPIPSLYLGQVYGFSLPWHNTLVISAVTVPVLMGLLGIVGLVACWRHRRVDRAAFLWPLSWGTLMLVRALPLAPGHDVERQFLASFVSLAALVGLGAGELSHWLKPYRLSWAAGGLAAAAMAEATAGIVQLYPYTLSYYNVAVGGLSGAEKRGFELTYYWDTMGPELLGWMRQKAREEPLEVRFPSDLINLRFLRAWGALPPELRVVGLENTERPYYVLQRRRGLYYPYDQWLDQHGQPCFTIRRQGIDLLRVYTFEQSHQAYLQTIDLPIPEHLQH